MLFLKLNKQGINFLKRHIKLILKSFLFLFMIGLNIASQEMPTIVFSKSESEESGIKLEFLLSDYIERY